MSVYNPSDQVRAGQLMRITRGKLPEFFTGAPFVTLGFCLRTWPEQLWTQITGRA